VLTCYYLLCVYEQGMGTPLMTKLGSSKVMDAGADSHVPTPNARKQAATNPTFNNYKTADGRWIQMLGLETPRCALACGNRLFLSFPYVCPEPVLVK
jgi:hypothetical protein